MTLLFTPAWATQLQPASFRAIEFQVTASEVSRGRRIVTHTYPGKDLPYCEDLGRSVQELSFTAFLVGDDVYDQRDQLADVCDKAGTGKLVHPSVGSVNATLISAAFEERADEGRMVTVSLRFVLSEEIKFPSLFPRATNSLDAKPQGILDTIGAAIKDFTAKVKSFLNQVMGAIKEFLAPILAVARTALAFVGMIGAVAGLALAACSAVRGLLPHQSGSNYGRYQLGNRRIAAPTASTATLRSATASTEADVTLTLRNACSARETVTTAALQVHALASAGAPEFPQALADLVEATRSVILDPADQIAALIPLAQFQPVIPPPSAAPIAQMMTDAVIATAALARRCALASLAAACSAYEPISASETQQVIACITPLFEAEITTAADLGDLDSFRELRRLKTRTVQDLRALGARLPQLLTITRKQAMPSLLLSQQLYQTASRSDEIIRRSDAHNPCFCPTTFQALSE